jgi:hypothetical protein
MDFFSRLFRRGPRADKDDAAIAALARSGVDLRQPAMLRHYLYFAFEYEARVVAAELGEQGFDIDVRVAPMNSGILVLARRAQIPERESIRQLRASLEAVAQSQKGEYDGWEAELPSGEAIAGAAART